MKRCIALIILIGFINLISAQVLIQKIVASNDNPMVSRVAITLSEKTEWSYTIDKDTHVVKVTIKNCDVDNPSVSGISSSNLVSSIDLLNNMNNGLVVFTLNGPFFIETMSVENPFKIVLDLFVYKKTYTFQEQLSQAAFYEKSNMWTKANRQYQNMQRDFPQNLDLNYYWGNLLIRQKKYDSAKNKLLTVPESSGFYRSAQLSLAKLENKDTQQTEQTKSEISDRDSANTTVEKAPVVPTTVLIEERKPFRFFDFQTIFGQSTYKQGWFIFVSKLEALPIWFWLVFLVVLAIVILVVFDIVHVRKQYGKKKKSKAPKIKADNTARMEIIMKLLNAGWQEEEIARELLVSIKEVKLYITQGKKGNAKKTKDSI